MTIGRLRPLLPYILLAPGLAWLTVFFVVPMYTLARQSLNDGTLETGFGFAWEWANYSNVIDRYQEQFIRSFRYAGTATVLAFIIGYPLAYAIAFRGGRFKSHLLFLVVLPFFTTYLIRTLAWQTILSDQGDVLTTLRDLGVLRRDQAVDDRHDADRAERNEREKKETELLGVGHRLGGGRGGLLYGTDCGGAGCGRTGCANCCMGC